MSPLHVQAFRSPAEGCVAYLVMDAGEALALDPRLDQVDLLLDAAKAAGTRIARVLDTHTHADHLSGARRLAERSGAALLAHPRSKLQARHEPLGDGAVFRVGASEARAIHTPGHTPDSLSILVGGHLFTGDALFTDGAGRTDFPGGSASDLYDSFRRLEALPDGTEVHPGHDYAGRASIPLGEAKRTNRLLAERDREALVKAMDLKGAPPAGMAAILELNLSASDPVGVLPAELDARIRGGEPLNLLDVRTPLEFSSERIEGSRNLPLAGLEPEASRLPQEGILVCSTGVRASMAAQTLAAKGLSYRVLEGGLRAWEKGGLPLKRGRKRLSLDRQVQIAVGTGVLSGVLLGAFVHPAFLILSGIFGAGLAFAGLSGTCGMGMLLSKAPWNRMPSDAGSPATSCAVGGAKP